MTRSERKPTPSGVGPSDSTAHQSTSDDRLHPKRLSCGKRYREVRKTAKTWLLCWGQPGLPKGYHTVPERAAPRPARADKKQPCAGLGHTAIGGGVSGRWPGPRPRGNRGATVAGSGYGPPISRRANTPDPMYGANPVPANRSTREGKFATGCGITGMPTASGIPRLQPWEEVKRARPRRVAAEFDLKNDPVMCPDALSTGRDGCNASC